MILPRLSGRTCRASWRPAISRARPIIVMERIEGESLRHIGRAGALAGRRDRGSRRAHRPRPAGPASPERAPSRPQARQHHASAQTGRGLPRFRPLAPRRAAGPAGRGIRRADGHRPLHRARADPRRPRRAAQRHLSRSASCSTSSRPASWPFGNPQRKAGMHAPALARPGAAAQHQPRDPAMAAGDHPALPGGRSRQALRHGRAARLRPAEPRPGRHHRTRPPRRSPTAR